MFSQKTLQKLGKNLFICSSCPGSPDLDLSPQCCRKLQKPRCAKVTHELVKIKKKKRCAKVTHELVWVKRNSFLYINNLSAFMSSEGNEFLRNRKRLRFACEKITLFWEHAFSICNGKYTNGLPIKQLAETHFFFI